MTISRLLRRLDKIEAAKSGGEDRFVIRFDEWEDPAKRGAFLQQRAGRGYVIAPETIPAEQWVEEYRPGGLIGQWLGGPDQRHDTGPPR